METATATDIPDELSLERIRQARETLTAAFSKALHGMPGAVQCDDPAGVFCEAKRNLTAMIQILHGEQAWLETLDED